MSLLDTIYHNSAIFALTLASDNEPIINLIIMYIFFYSSLPLVIVGIYRLLTARKFFPPIYFKMEDVMGHNKYGFSALIMTLIGCAILFPLYIFYFFFAVIFLLVMWWIYKWIYKKLMFK